MSEFHERFGTHVHLLDWSLHLDESTPHIHERHVFDCENKYGEVAPQQEKALEALGFDLPDPGKPLSRRNNRKIIFDAACRKMLFEIAKRHRLELEEEAEYGNRKYLEKQEMCIRDRCAFWAGSPAICLSAMWMPLPGSPMCWTSKAIWMPPHLSLIHI